MARVTLSGLTKSFDGRVAVHPFDLEIDEGELVVLLGPSRSGKSTILRMLAGLDAPDNGTIHFDGRDVTTVEPRYRDVGMFFQNFALYPNRTGRQNIGASLEGRAGAGADQTRRRVDEVADLLGVTHLLDRRPETYSGGEQQRVAIGRVIARRAAVYAFDEPLSNLDALVRLRLRTEFKRISQELGVTTLYVTPDQVEAMALADRVVVLNEGRIVQVGTPRELYERPANPFVAAFVGATPMNVLSVVDHGNELVTEAGTTITVHGGDRRGVPADADRAAVVGIRPEDLKVKRGGATRVRLTESLGRRTLVHLEGGAPNLRVLAPLAAAIEENELVGVSCDAEAVHRFDGDAGSASG